MGYTHYLTQRARFTNAEWFDVKAAISSIAALASQEGLKLGDMMGEQGRAWPEVETGDSGEYIGFNGLGEESHETFSIGQDRAPLESWQDEKARGWIFCKTDRKPYDVAVTACLCYLESAFPGKVYVSSDGRADDWQAGLALARRALPALQNVLTIPKDVTFESLFSRVIFSGGGLALAVLQDGSLCIADFRTYTIRGIFKTAEGAQWAREWSDRMAKERQRKLPAKIAALDRWQASKMRDFAQGAAVFKYI